MIFSLFVFISQGDQERPEREGVDALQRRGREEAGLTQMQGDDGQSGLGLWSGA